MKSHLAIGLFSAAILCTQARGQPDGAHSGDRLSEAGSFRSQLLESIFQNKVGTSDSDLAIIARSQPLDSWRFSDETDRTKLLQSLADVVVRLPGTELSLTQPKLVETYGKLLADSQWATGVVTAKADVEAISQAVAALYESVDRTRKTAIYQKYTDAKEELQKIISEESNLDTETTAAPRLLQLQQRSRELTRLVEDMNRTASFSKHELVLERQQRANPAISLEGIVRKFDAHKSGAVSTTFPGSLSGFLGSSAWTTISLQFPANSKPSAILQFTMPSGGLPDIVALPEGGTIRLEVARLTIARPWLDMDFFSNPAWRLADNRIVSSGTGTPSAAEILPYVTTEIYLVRNLALEYPFDSDLRKTLRKAIKAGANVALCGLTLSGSTLSPDEDDSIYVPPSYSSDGIRFPCVQFVGWKLRRVPNSPSPGTNYTWPN